MNSSAIAAGTVICLLAYVTGDSGVVPKRVGLPYNHSLGSQLDAPIRPQTMSLQDGECNAAVLTWFTAIPKRLRACSGADAAGVLPLGAADVNGDGVIEYFDADYSPYRNYSQGGVPVAGVGITLGGVVLSRTTTEVLPTETVVWRTSVLSVGNLESVLEEFCGCNITNADLFASGWRDCDHDGDLDLVVTVIYRVWGASGSFAFQVWYENEGFEADPPPLAADINEDGVVDGKDLASVLSAWTP